MSHHSRNQAQEGPLEEEGLELSEEERVKKALGFEGWEVESEWLAALDGSVTYDVCYAVSVGSIVSTHDKTHSVYRCLVRQLGLERW